MHILATNLCIWVRILVTEVVHGLHLSDHHHDETDPTTVRPEHPTQSDLDDHFLVDKFAGLGIYIVLLLYVVKN